MIVEVCKFVLLIYRSTRSRRKGQRLHAQPENERHTNKTLGTSEPNTRYYCKNQRIGTCFFDVFLFSSGKAGQRRRRVPARAEQELIEDVLPSIRRSCRQRRGVYGTLNVNMLTDHRLVHTYESFPVVEIKEHDKERALEDELDDQVSWEENLNLPPF